MPNPKRRHSNSRTGKRRNTHKKISDVSLGTCTNCGEKKLPHSVCSACGYYKDKPVLTIKKKEK
ncbi:MAG TPA: 50S ribosomal protein L32 [bacterium]|jgi:large subunit ribosomal protein L32|nr:50S ribosomal protein L32 [bacterium]